ncbi:MULTISPECIES: hypothetical protein [Paraburkholderia]|uniref:hypothetical protein n=1 Tax=Paraburkholderia TaxID=1822464 RepID=UPI0038BDB574
MNATCRKSTDCSCSMCLSNYPERRNRRMPDPSQYDFRARIFYETQHVFPQPKPDALPNCPSCHGAGKTRGGLHCNCWEVYVSGGDFTEDVSMSDSIAKNYASIQKRVMEGSADWACIDPYEVADWAAVLTPVEFGAWQDIRSEGLPLWPRLPVGDLVVSFGNPAAKVGLQCGDDEESARVAHWLSQTGWRVFRATAAQCTRVMETPADVRERTGDVSDAYRARYLAETLAGTVQDLRHALIAARVQF